MNTRAKTIVTIAAILTIASTVQARIKMVALPERADTIIRLDNPNATLIEEERVLTLQAGINKVDFSWKAVSIDPDSIRLAVLDHPKDVKLLNVSYPPGEAALVWEIACNNEKGFAETVRISYLLRNIDRLVTYKAIADKEETKVDLKSFLILRNFSGEDFDKVQVKLDYGESFDKGILHEETKQMLFFAKPEVPITKIWTWNSKMTWDPEDVPGKNIGIPVSYRIKNDKKSNLGEYALWGGKARIFLDDGLEGTIFLGEDRTGLVPVGEKTELYIGDSRDIVVTQRMMNERKLNEIPNNDGRIVMYDREVPIVAKIENFKDKPATLTMIQYMPGEWDMKDKDVNMKYEKINSNTLKFEIQLPARTKDGPGKKELKMKYYQRHIRR
ncbi:MAG: DUF4139 domain-containing protein [Planctomycetes bacterium]|nr:DUF4139 domain-containing protein [Planctomycetota bacterium]